MKTHTAPAGASVVSEETPDELLERFFAITRDFGTEDFNIAASACDIPYGDAIWIGKVLEARKILASLPNDLRAKARARQR